MQGKIIGTNEQQTILITTSKETNRLPILFISFWTFNKFNSKNKSINEWTVTVLSTKDSFSRVDKLDVLLSTEDSKKKYSCTHFDSLSHHGRLALGCYLLKTVGRLPITKIREISLSTEDSKHKSFCFTFWFGFGSRLLGTCITCGCSSLLTRFYWR